MDLLNILLFFIELYTLDIINFVHSLAVITILL
jgi:hypothetical protein